MTYTDRDFLSFSQYDDKDLFYSERNRYERQFLDCLELSHIQSYIPMQVHGTNIVEASHAKNTFTEQVIEADGLYSFKDHRLLGVTVADCAGIILYEPQSHFVAALHSGWKGTSGADNTSHNISKRKSILRRCVEEVIMPTNILTKNIYAWISPSAKACCYEIGKELVPLFTRYPQCIMSRNQNGKFYLDISLYIYEELLDLGFIQDHIIRDTHCTICDPQFHSHRRDGANAGRGIVFIAC